MLFKGINICCPHCRGELAENQLGDRQLNCTGCNRTYPIIFGIPDLRVFPDPYIDVESDRAKGLMLVERFDDMDFSELVEYYYSITSVVPPKHAEQYKRGLNSGFARAGNKLDCWLARLSSERDTSSRVLLDLGCGTAPLLVAAKPLYAKVVGIDIAFRWLVIAKKRLSVSGLDIPLICACAEALPFPSGSFDVVVADSVIEVVQDQSDALAECCRALVSGGHLFLSTANRFSLGPDPHVGLWAGTWLPDRLMAAYARREGAIPPLRRLLTPQFLGRLLVSAGFDAYDLFLPDISDEQRLHYGMAMRLLIDVYMLLKNVPWLRSLLTYIAPSLQAIANRPISA